MACTHMLIPTDFSEPAHRALRYALEEATFHHANVTLLHVLPAHTGTDVYVITGGPGARPDFEPALERRLGTPTPRQPTGGAP
jgi:nucleotide-binding universal stress UspA family protein